MEFKIWLENKDLEYAKAYAARIKASAKSPQYVQEMKDAIANIIQNGVRAGFVSVFVGSQGLTEENKEKLSMLRYEAQRMGYQVGQWQFNANAHTATAPIVKT